MRFTRIDKKEVNRYMRIRNANKGKSVMALYELYQKDITKSNRT
jgi:hypothetical protein